MPIVEFKCPKCGKTIDKLVNNTAKAKLPKCKSCGTVMEKMFSSHSKPFIH